MNKEELEDWNKHIEYCLGDYLGASVKVFATKEQFDKYEKNKDERINELQQRIIKALDLLNEPQFEFDNIPCNYENDIEKLKQILRGEE